METAADLMARAEAFAQTHPDHADFVEKLIVLIRKIECEFSGEERQRLLADAANTFDRQQKVVESTKRALEALEDLKQQQRQVIQALTRLAAFRPPDATLH